MKLISVKRRGKITAKDSELKALGIPERFYDLNTNPKKEVIIFGEPVKEDGQEYYICGDCEDDFYKYYIPTEWVIEIPYGKDSEGTE